MKIFSTRKFFNLSKFHCQTARKLMENYSQTTYLFINKFFELVSELQCNFCNINVTFPSKVGTTPLRAHLNRVHSNRIYNGEVELIESSHQKQLRIFFSRWKLHRRLSQLTLGNAKCALATLLSPKALHRVVFVITSNEFIPTSTNNRQAFNF